jgi:hypothetical protein
MGQKMLTPQWSHVLPVFMKVGIVCWSVVCHLCLYSYCFHIYIFYFFNVIVYESRPVFVSPMMPVSLDCPFLVVINDT